MYGPIFHWHIDVLKRSRSLFYTAVIETSSHQDTLSNGNDEQPSMERGVQCLVYWIMGRILNNMLGRLLRLLGRVACTALLLRNKCRRCKEGHFALLTETSLACAMIISSISRMLIQSFHSIVLFMVSHYHSEWSSLHSIYGWNGPNCSSDWWLLTRLIRINTIIHNECRQRKHMMNS